MRPRKVFAERKAFAIMPMRRLPDVIRRHAEAPTHHEPPGLSDIDL
jgi:hypothetical protein